MDLILAKVPHVQDLLYDISYKYVVAVTSADVQAAFGAVRLI
jgi:hypothetical protein